jgi:hypothetical protein
MSQRWHRVEPHGPPGRHKADQEYGEREQQYNLEESAAFGSAIS